MTSRPTERDSALALLDAGAVRQRAQQMHALAVAGRLLHFDLAQDRLPGLAHYVAGIVRQNYPDLAVPFHARWRHFQVAGVDRWAPLCASHGLTDAAARARAEFDLAIVSVLLDAGAGPHWRYRDRSSGRAIGRSEGLALASLDMFAAGTFSADPRDPLRADAARLAQLTPADLAKGFQVTDDNPLDGLDGRVALLNALGRNCQDHPDIFAGHDRPRPGGLFDRLRAQAVAGALPAPRILRELLLHLGAIWPARLTLGGVSLGDTWRHPLIAAADATDGLVPFHKLSQWLSYSLIEPLIAAGIAVTDLDGLTGLPEYRNGGLFIDGGVLRPRDPALVAMAHRPDSTVIVEWRALTVALLDALLPLVQRALQCPPADFPLACLLEGGSWSAGRAIAREKRADGGPPLTIISDGTVF